MPTVVFNNEESQNHIDNLSAEAKITLDNQLSNLDGDVMIDFDSEGNVYLKVFPKGIFEVELGASLGGSGEYESGDLSGALEVSAGASGNLANIGYTGVWIDSDDGSGKILETSAELGAFEAGVSVNALDGEIEASAQISAVKATVGGYIIESPNISIGDNGQLEVSQTIIGAEGNLSVGNASVGVPPIYGHLNLECDLDNPVAFDFPSGGNWWDPRDLVEAVDLDSPIACDTIEVGIGGSTPWIGGGLGISVNGEGLDITGNTLLTPRDLLELQEKGLQAEIASGEGDSDALQEQLDAIQETLSTPRVNAEENHPLTDAAGTADDAMANDVANITAELEANMDLLFSSIERYATAVQGI